MNYISEVFQWVLFSMIIWYIETFIKKADKVLSASLIDVPHCSARSDKLWRWFGTALKRLTTFNWGWSDTVHTWVAAGLRASPASAPGTALSTLAGQSRMGRWCWAAGSPGCCPGERASPRASLTKFWPTRSQCSREGRRALVSPSHMQTPDLCSLPTPQSAVEAGQAVLRQVLPLARVPNFTRLGQRFSNQERQNIRVATYVWLWARNSQLEA